MKETIIQFGEGNFLRGFFDYFLHVMNKNGLYDGKAVVIQPREGGKCGLLNEQNCKYNLYLRGIDKGEIKKEHHFIESISRGIDPYKSFDEYMSLAENPDLKFVVSNTTEAGIAFDDSCSFNDKPCKSFPGKLTQLLYKRYKSGLSGLILLPCELIDNNGDELKKCVFKYAEAWGLEDSFVTWINNENTFSNTLVDRIVTGYPNDETAKLHKEDKFLDTAEIFHLWVIEGNFEDELPLKKAGFNVIWTDDAKPYKKIKVRILNGAHTSLVAGAILSGLETVGQAMGDETAFAFLNKAMKEEILSTIGENEDSIAFASSVFDRFKNPFIHHKWRAIALNSVSKFSVRVLPTILEYKEKTNRLPKCLTMSLAFLIYFYKNECPEDAQSVIEAMKSDSIEDILKNEALWGENLSDMIDTVTEYYNRIDTVGAKDAMKWILSNEKDNVCVDLNTGHKIAVANIKKGENVIKYGYPIGYATENISKGEGVHSHNMKTKLGDILSYEYKPNFEALQEKEPFYINAFIRENGDIGIRNDIWIIPTVGCVNSIGKQLSEKTGEIYFSHPYGCSQLGDDMKTTQLVLKGLINHPNKGGVLVLGLGCENNNIPEMKKVLGEWDEERVKFLSVQDCEDEISEGVRLIEELKKVASRDERKPVPVSKLKIGLKCGGSDGFSGITANAVVGKVTDEICSMGGSAVLTEVPEMFGAEAVLFERCINEDIFNKSVKLINDFKKYFKDHGQPVSENPSPGNKEGGITTLEEKSLGCVQKGGRAPVVDVLDYGDSVRKSGLSLLNGPGNDIVSITNLSAVGCHLVLFTTGRGTPLGGAVPTVKIASNDTIAQKKPHWIDFSACGLDNSEKAKELLALIKNICDGEPTKNEAYGNREIAIFKDGVTL